MVANAENEISLTRLQASQVTSQLQRLQQTLDEHNTAAKEKNDLISDAEAEILKNNSLVERKQMQIDQLAKKIYHKMSELDGVSIKVHQLNIIVLYKYWYLLNLILHPNELLLSYKNNRQSNQWICYHWYNFIITASSMQVRTN